MRAPATTLALLCGLACASPARADDECAAPMSDWQPRDAVEQMAQGHGWTVQRIRIDEGCYELEVLDGEGRTSRVTVDPSTLALLGDEHEDSGHGQDDTGHPAIVPDATYHED